MKAGAREAQQIASGVTAVVLELQMTQRPDERLPIYVRAPLEYVADMVAAKVCEREGWPDDRIDDVSRYLMAGLQEYAVALFETFDVEHMAAWLQAEANDRARSSEVLSSRPPGG